MTAGTTSTAGNILLEIPARKIRIFCTSGTANINIPGLHRSGETFPIPSGKDVEFEGNTCSITSFNVSGTFAINFGITSVADY